MNRAVERTQGAENGRSLGGQRVVPVFPATRLFHECRRVPQSVVKMGPKPGGASGLRSSWLGSQATPTKLMSHLLYRITNATSTGFNRMIKASNYAACGLCSFTNYRTRIVVFCGRLALRPQCRRDNKAQRTRNAPLSEEVLLDRCLADGCHPNHSVRASGQLHTHSKRQFTLVTAALVA
jgi:hypothetical protein